MPDVAASFHEGIRSVRTARRLVVETLENWAVAGYDFGAQQVLTELATNAVLFSPPPFRVRLSFEAGRLRVEVHDNTTRLPRPRNYGPEATTGRGLHLVAELCDDWGATPNGTGKMVWATVRRDETT
jgi:signal transduction histidine kinase